MGFDQLKVVDQIQGVLKVALAARFGKIEGLESFKNINKP